MSSAASIVARRFIMGKKFQGFPKISDFDVVKEEIQPLKKDGIANFQATLLASKQFIVNSCGLCF